MKNTLVLNTSSQYFTKVLMLSAAVAISSFFILGVDIAFASGSSGSGGEGFDPYLCKGINLNPERYGESSLWCMSCEYALDEYGTTPFWCSGASTLAPAAAPYVPGLDQPVITQFCAY